MLLFRQKLRKQYLTAKHQIQEDFDQVKAGYYIKNLNSSAIAGSSEGAPRSKSITPFAAKHGLILGGSAVGTVSSGKNSTPSLNKSNISYTNQERGLRTSTGRKDKSLGRSELIMLPVASNVDSETEGPQIRKTPNNYMYRGAVTGVYSLAKKRKSAGAHNINRSGRPIARLEKTSSISELNNSDNISKVRANHNKTAIIDDPYTETIQREEDEDPLNLTPNPIYIGQHTTSKENRSSITPDPVLKRINEIRNLENTKLLKIQEMRDMQNKKLKLLIEAEQDSENKREEMLRVEKSPTMKIKLEKKFIIERAQATSKINNLSEYVIFVFS